MYVQRNRGNPAAAFGAALAAVTVFAVFAAVTISLGGRKHDNLPASALFAAWGLVAGAVYAGFAPGRRLLGAAALAPLLACGAALTAAGVDAAGQTLSERAEFHGLGGLTPLFVGVYAFVAVLCGTAVGAVLVPDLTRLGAADVPSGVSLARLAMVVVAAAAAVVSWRGHGVQAASDLSQDVAALRNVVESEMLPTVFSYRQPVLWEPGVTIGSRQSREVHGTLGPGTVSASLLPKARLAFVQISIPLDPPTNVTPGERLPPPPGLWREALPTDRLAGLGVRADFVAGLRPASDGTWEQSNGSEAGRCHLSILSGGTCYITMQRENVARLP